MVVEENPSTGFKWFWTVDGQQEAVTFLDSYVEQMDPEQPLVGMPGQKTILFKVDPDAELRTQFTIDFYLLPPG